MGVLSLWQGEKGNHGLAVELPQKSELHLELRIYRTTSTAIVLSCYDFNYRQKHTNLQT